MPRRPELLVLAMDLGSSSTRSAFFDESGQVLPGTGASRNYAISYSADGGAELSPLTLRHAAAECWRRALQTRRESPSLRKIPIAAVSASAFWHSLLALDRKGRPITPIYTWADSRCTVDAASLREEFDERKIHERTGCMLRASYWPAKLRWLRRTQRHLFNRVARWVSPAEWIFEELLGVAGCSHSMASGTGFYDYRTRQWDTALCEACGLTPAQLGSLTNKTSVKRCAFPELREATFFPAIGDGAAGNLGCGADVPGRTAINVGTSAAVRVITQSESRAPLGLFRYSIDRARGVIGGAVSNAGNLRRWCLRELRLTETSSALEKMLSRTAAASDEITVLPFWVNERAPTWPENLPGAIVGFRQATSAAQILRAATCAVFYRLGMILDLVENATGPAKDIIVSGGILKSPASLLLLADAIGRDIRISPEREASLRGAAVYALEKMGRELTPLLKGRVVRHRPALSAKHRLRRERQMALEKALSSAATS
ncbi:MAG: gluconokinase [Verrucomicrobiota bacterium]|jgi:gluconokinase